MMFQHAKVFLVGSGPGEPGLLTLRGAQCLARADLVLFDYLVNPQLLVHARLGAELVCLGRHGQGRIMSQAEINERMITAAQAGQTVVRLKAGDPVVFAHAAEELAALDRAGICYEIVPGITAALAVGSYTGIPLTQGGAASAVALVTAQQRANSASDELDYRALAAFPGTLVFYMGVTTARQWTAALINAGKPPETPAAIVRRCSWPDQEVIQTTLAEVANEISSRQMRPPAMVVVGRVAAIAQEHSWWMDRPLFGKRVLITRASSQAATLADSLAELGAGLAFQPAIEIGPPQDWTPVDAAISRLKEFDWLVFTSTNGVRGLLDRLLEKADLRALADIKVAAVGSGTADELAKYYLRADLRPAEFQAEALAADLSKACGPSRKALLARGTRGRDVLFQRLQSDGIAVDEVVVYTSRDVEQSDPEIAALLAAGKIDWITVTSPAIAASLVNLFGDHLRRAQLASISPLTSSKLRELGHFVAAEASEYSIPGLAAAICAAESGAR